MNLPDPGQMLDRWTNVPQYIVDHSARGRHPRSTTAMVAITPSLSYPGGQRGPGPWNWVRLGSRGAGILSVSSSPPGTSQVQTCRQGCPNVLQPTISSRFVCVCVSSRPRVAKRDRISVNITLSPVLCTLSKIKFKN